MIGIVSVWLVRRNQAAGMPGTLNRSDVAVTRMAAVASPAGQPVTVADLLQLTPGEFEDFVGDLLTATGMCTDVRRIGGAGDRGADLLANDRFNRPFIVQCKRYHPGHKVRAGEMRNFLGAKGIYGADECLFVTTSTFTEAARENMLHLRNTVFLWDGERLAEVAREYWNSLPERWRYTIRDAHVSIDS
jgi:restriction system protein